LQILRHELRPGEGDGLEFFACPGVEKGEVGVLGEKGFQLIRLDHHFLVVGMTLLETGQGFFDRDFVLRTYGGERVLGIVGARLTPTDVEGREQGTTGPRILFEENLHGEGRIKIQAHGRRMPQIESWERGELGLSFEGLPWHRSRSGSMAEQDEEPKIYLLPNLMTAGNLLCGFLAILTIFKGMQTEGLLEAKEYYQQAMLYIFGSCLFDLLDGRLARLGGQESPFGQEFDSLADMVSFGLAPAMLVSRAVLAEFELPERFDPEGAREIGVTWAIAFIYLLCGGIRLARFNCLARMGTSSGDFRGIPIPMAAGFVASLTFIMISFAENERSLGWLSYVLAVMILGISLLMVSSVRYPSFKKIDLRTKANVWTLLGLAILLGFLFNFRVYAPALVFLIYLLTPLFRRRKEDEEGEPAS